MIEGQTVSGLHLLSMVRPLEIDQAGQKRNAVLDFSSPLVNATTIYDASGKGNHGTITGATWSRLPSGLPYLDLDGTDDFVDLGEVAALLPATGSISLWIRGDSASEYKSYFLAKYVAATDGFYVGAATGRTTGLAIKEANVWKTAGSGVLPGVTGVWCKFTGTFDGTNMRGYYNGALVETTAAAGYGLDHLAGTNNMFLGKHYDDGAWRYADGGVALLRMTTSIITAEQDAQDFARERHLFGASI